MAVDVQVNVDDATVISALNTPGGDVFIWRDETAEQIMEEAIFISPVNNPLNAKHRGGIVGTYKRSWSWDRIGSNGNRVRAVIENTAGHAYYVEYGRGQSHGFERFSWTGHRPPGAIRNHPNGTAGYEGNHILRDSTNVIMPTRCDGYTPLV